VTEQHEHGTEQSNPGVEPDQFATGWLFILLAATIVLVVVSGIVLDSMVRTSAIERQKVEDELYAPDKSAEHEKDAEHESRVDAAIDKMVKDPNLVGGTTPEAKQPAEQGETHQ